MNCETCLSSIGSHWEGSILKICLHGPSKHGAQVLDTNVLGHELVLSSNIVVKRDFGKVLQRRVVGRRRRFAVAEESGDDDEVLVYYENTKEHIKDQTRRKTRNGTFFGFSVLSSPINQTLSYIAAKMLTKGGFFYGTSKI